MILNNKFVHLDLESKFLIQNYIFIETAMPKISPPMLDDRIVGGVAVTIEEYPYQVTLLHREIYICGGSIIGATWVVTAAHCTDW